MINRIKKMQTLAVSLLVCLLLAGTVGQGAESPTWQHAYQFPHGSGGPLLVNNGYAYILNGWTRGHLVQAYDVHKPKSPTYVGGIPGRGYPLVGAFSQNGKYLYIPTWFSLMVVDVSAPAKLKTIRAMSFGFPYGDAGPITVYQDKLFMGGKRGGGIRVFDITQPDAPLITAWYPKYGAVEKLIASEKLLLIQKRRKPLIVCSLGDSKITEVATLDIRGSYFLRGDLLYHVNLKNLSIYDLSDPVKPVKVETGKIPALSIVGIMSDDEILVVEDKNKLAVYDLENPLAPIKKREIELENASELSKGAKIKGSLVFRVNGSKGALVIYDINGKVAKEVGLANYIRNECRLEVGEKYAWSFFGDGGILRARATDLSKPGISPIVFSVDIGNIERKNQMRVFDVFRAGAGKKIGNFLLMGDGLVDISNPKKPKVIKSASVPALSILVKNGLAFLAQGKQMTILDVSKLPEMKTLGIFTPPGDGNHIADIIVEGRYAYLINNAKANRKDPNDKTKPSLLILDVSDPTQPLLKGSCSTASSISGAKKENYIYLAGVWGTDRAGDIEIIDVSNPSSPKVVKHLDDDSLLSTCSYRARIRGNRLFVTDSMRGIKELDISNPLNPKYVRSYFGPTETSSSYTDFELVGDKLYGQRYSQIDVWEIGK